MITPQFLRTGDTIGLVSPAKQIDTEYVNRAKGLLEAKGYRVVTGGHVVGRHHQFAGTDAERAADFQQMMDDREVGMILCTRGGYGSARIIDRLNFRGFMRNPKWIAGFSDITVFHAHVYSVFGIQSVHGIMPLDFPDSGESEEAVDRLLAAVSGGTVAYSLPAHPLNRSGYSEACVVGGNLSILASLLGSRSDLPTGGRILFIEEVGENLYRLDRLMVSMKRAGKLDELTGLIVGGLTGMEDNEIPFGKNAQEIVYDAVAGYDYPVCFDFPAGHFPENYPLLLGRLARFEVAPGGVKLEYQ